MGFWVEVVCHECKYVEETSGRYVEAGMSFVRQMNEIVTKRRWSTRVNENAETIHLCPDCSKKAAK